MEYRNIEGTKATYSYMPNGYRKSKNVKGSITNFLWDGDNIAMELDTRGNAKNRCHRGLNGMAFDSSNKYVYDIHGSVMSVVN